MARILDISPITDAAQMPIKKGTLQFLEDAHKISLNQALLGQVGDSYNGLNCYVLWGCVNTGSFPNYDISAGAVWYLGEVYEVDATTFTITGGNVAVATVVTTQYTTYADPVTFTDASTHNVHNIRKVSIGAAASGSGIADFSDLVYDAVRYPQATETVIGVAEIATQAEVNAGLDDERIVTASKLAVTPTVMHVDGAVKRKIKVIEIGAWDMSSASTLTVAHGLSTAFSKVRRITVMIQNDTSSQLSEINITDSGFALQGSCNGITILYVYLNRLTGGVYDSSDYSTATNRGWITFEMEA